MKFSRIENDTCLGRSTVIDLYIDPVTKKVRNQGEYKRLLDILSILTSVPEEDIDFAFETYEMVLYSKLEEDVYDVETVLNPENHISRETVAFYENEIKKLKQQYI
jgi:hypothetical protein